MVPSSRPSGSLDRGRAPHSRRRSRSRLCRAAGIARAIAGGEPPDPVRIAPPAASGWRCNRRGWHRLRGGCSRNSRTRRRASGRRGSRGNRSRCGCTDGRTTARRRAGASVPRRARISGKARSTAPTGSPAAGCVGEPSARMLTNMPSLIADPIGGDQPALRVPAHRDRRAAVRAEEVPVGARVDRVRELADFALGSIVAVVILARRTARPSAGWWCRRSTVRRRGSGAPVSMSRK